MGTNYTATEAAALGDDRGPVLMDYTLHNLLHRVSNYSLQVAF